jgi:hypothetical protein
MSSVNKLESVRWYMVKYGCKFYVMVLAMVVLSLWVMGTARAQTPSVETAPKSQFFAGINARTILVIVPSLSIHGGIYLNDYSALRGQLALYTGLVPSFSADYIGYFQSQDFLASANYRTYLGIGLDIIGSNTFSCIWASECPPGATVFFGPMVGFERRLDSGLFFAELHLDIGFDSGEFLPIPLPSAMIGLSFPF